jgi:hypothetical protein
LLQITVDPRAPVIEHGRVRLHDPKHAVATPEAIQSKPPTVRPAVSSAAAVLALQTAAGNRATRWALSRRELPDTLAASTYHAEESNWTTSDRVNNTAKWQTACEFNLRHLRSADYREIAERRDFYKWFYEATAAKGWQTRWALAAYIVAGGMAEMAEIDWSEGLSPLTNEVQGLARIGNQVIFDDVLPKLRGIYDDPSMKDPTKARERDQQVLAEEQHMIQNLYKGLSDETMKRFERIANMYYTRAQVGQAAKVGGWITAGPYNVGGKVPTFSSLVPDGDIRKPEDRWRYGMALAETVSTLPGYGKADAMPAVGSAYSTATQFDRLNVRPNLHMIDARLNDTDIPEAEVVSYLKRLTTPEQRELHENAWRVQRLGGALSYAEMVDGIADLAHVMLNFKMLLLDFALRRSWTSVDYDEIQPIIVLAGKHHPKELELLHNDRWRKVFLDVCDDDTIVNAVVDLRLPAAMAREWIAEEQKVF